jgi:pyridoxal phosphate enzyme (YggS family)
MGIADRYLETRDNIARIAEGCGRNPQDIQLLVVTKGHRADHISEVIEAGARMLGENYLQEAVEKMEFLEKSAEVDWHMIGHIQSNKAKDVVERFDFIHSIDRYKIANRLSRYAVESNIVLPCLLECNVSGEESKYGWPLWNSDQWAEFFITVEEVIKLKGITIEGLMTMPPYNPDPEKSRPVFKKLVELKDQLRRRFPDQTWEHLSVGMSDDYPVAIEEGATIVRIGTAIMGPRSQ